MNHLWRKKTFTIPGPVLNYGRPDIGGTQFMPVPPPKNPGCPIFGVGMPHGEAAGDALRATSHYGRPSREAMGLNGQTLLRVQRNGLKITNKI